MVYYIGGATIHWKCAGICSQAPYTVNEYWKHPRSLKICWHTLHHNGKLYAHCIHWKYIVTCWEDSCISKIPTHWNYTGNDPIHWKHIGISCSMLASSVRYLYILIYMLAICNLAHIDFTTYTELGNMVQCMTTYFQCVGIDQYWHMFYYFGKLYIHWEGPYCICWKYVRRSLYIVNSWGRFLYIGNMYTSIRNLSMIWSLL